MTSYRAKRTPRFNSVAAWNEILAPYGASAALARDCTADLVIIGAGFAGLSAARRARALQPAANIIVLDALRVGDGSAGRNSGFMIDLPHDLSSSDYAGQGAGYDTRLTQLNREAIQFALDAVDDYAIPSDYAERVGKVNGAASAAGEAHNHSYHAHLNALGEPSDWLDAQQMYDLTGSRHYRAGLYTPGTMMLQPAGYIRGLVTGLRRDGVQIFEESAVTGFSRSGSGWQVQTGNAVIATPRIILATNGHLESFGVSRGRLVQLFLYASMSPDLDAEALAKLGGAARWGVTPSDPMGTTMRRIDTAQGGNRVITRTCASVRPEMEVSPADVARAAAVQRRKFDTRYPKLAGLKMEYEWAGHLCLSLNGVAVAREIDDGVFSACVQNGLGTARGTLTGIAAAEAAFGHTSDITQFFEAEAAPKKLPPEPLATLGANTYLRWKEWRARAE